MFPLLQSTIDLSNTTTPNKFHIEQNAQIPMEDVPPPLINHSSMEHHYTKSVSHMAECTYTYGRHTPLQSTIDLCNTTTLNQFHVKHNADIPLL